MSEELHELAKEHAAAAHSTDFSGLITKLVLEDIKRTMRISEISADYAARADHPSVLVSPSQLPSRRNLNPIHAKSA